MHLKNIKNKKFGFTLIELLVVIAVIGLLASLGLASYNSARQKARDARRLSDINQIKTMLNLYIDKYGSLPSVYNYGESNSSPGWWDRWWDLSSGDGDGDGNYFLDFLVDGGITIFVPVDPVNTPTDFNGHPNSSGYFYFYFIAPKGYTYQGGSCVVTTNSVYLLGIRQFENAAHASFDSGCQCLWQNWPNFFLGPYDYITCGVIQN